MRRAHWALLAAVLAAAVAVPLALAEQTRSQRFFAEKLLADQDVADRVKSVLREGGFVEANITFRDLTPDDKDDAVVRVNSGGAPGVIAVYVFSTEGSEDDELRPVFASQKLVRASTRIVDNVLSYRYSRYRPGDELCCPSTIGEASLRWDRDRGRLVVSSRTTVRG